MSISKVPLRKVYGREQEPEVVFVKLTLQELGEVQATLEAASALVASEFQVLRRSLQACGVRFC